MDLSSYLNQTKLWISKKGVLKIDEMDANHRAHSARWLYGRSHLLLTLVETALHEHVICAEIDDPAQLHTLLGMLNKNPRHWIRDTPLFQELTKEIDPNGLVAIEFGPSYAHESEF